jgi:uncharacterized protein
MGDFLTLCAVLGHGFFWIGIVNRLHALDIPRRLLGALTGLTFFLCMAGVAGFGAWWEDVELLAMPASDPWGISPSYRIFVGTYLWLCWIVLAVTAIRWLWLVFHHRCSSTIHLTYFHKPLPLDLASAARSPEENVYHCFTRLPGNQSLDLVLTERAITVPRLPSALNGLAIVHLSDLHLSGKIGKAYFREVVRHCNMLKPDLAVITGDIIEKVHCIDWIPDTLGRLRAQHGVFFILGNHDRYIDHSLIRKTLVASGLTDLGGRWMRISIRDTNILLAGNELPWLTHTADLNRDQAQTHNDRTLRVLLAHTPDQFGWARRADIDLMLCGHLHGGQIRIPPIGALLTPSLWGVKFSHGLFHLPPTIMHVSRGISGKYPLRWFCPPEIALLKLHSLPVSEQGK